MPLTKDKLPSIGTAADSGMNWRKLIANIVYLIYMAVTLVIIVVSISVINPESIWASILYAIAAFFHILITMNIVYWLMPASIRVYWEDKSPNNPEGCRDIFTYFAAAYNSIRTKLKELL